MSEHWFWWLLTATAVIWYLTITIYVSIRGLVDIRDMLRDITTRQTKSRDEP